MLRLFLAGVSTALAAVLLPSYAGSPDREPPHKLLIFMVVDGILQRQINAYRDPLAPDRFARFLARGIWFADANIAALRQAGAI